jgi:SAM-dependent methyltransferase
MPYKHCASSFRAGGFTQHDDLPKDLAIAEVNRLRRGGHKCIRRSIGQRMWRVFIKKETDCGRKIVVKQEGRVGMKKIIDVCCGSKMFWFDRNNPDVVFNDKRKESHILCDGRALEIDPDTQQDFTALDYKSGTFNLVVFDPPHMTSLGKNSWMAKKYGVLPEKWGGLIRDGFKECYRILKVDGVLIFKWSDVDVSVNRVISVIGHRSLFGHRTMINNRTIWMCFMKKGKDTK